MPGDRATRGRAVREEREQGRGRPGRAAEGGTARAGGGRQQLLPVSGPKMSQPRDSGASTLLPVRMRTHSSRFRDSTEVPPRAPAIPRTHPPDPPTGGRRQEKPNVMEARRPDWPRAASTRPSSRTLRARAPLPAAPVIAAGAHTARPRPTPGTSPRPAPPPHRDLRRRAGSWTATPAPVTMGQ